MRQLALFLLTLILTACSLGATPEAPPSPEATEAQIALAPTLAVTEELSCDVLIRTAIDQVGSVCDSVGRNQACYGNNLIEVEFRPDAQGAQFESVGDIVELTSLQRLVTAPFDETRGVWGIAVVKAQANIEDAVPGQNVTFLLYGDAELENPTPDMTAVRIRTGVGEIECEGAPPAAVVIQSPNGREIAMNINGADVRIASTIYVTAEENKEMTIATIEGEAVVEAFGFSRTVRPGAQVRLPIDEELDVSGPPSEPEPFSLFVVQAAPVRLLEREVQIPSPIPSSTPTLSPTPRPPTATPTITPTATPCAPRADWTGSYTVQSGDTLSRIAQRYGVTLSELQGANCLPDADQIAAGQTIRVPLIATDTPEPTATTAAPAGRANLRADATILQPGQCTTIRWEATDAEQIYFEGQPARATGTREVCPTATTTYTLLIVTASGEQIPTRITIEVQRGGASCGNQTCERGEDALSCAADCAATCGNNVCEVGEDSNTCVADCPAEATRETRGG